MVERLESDIDRYMGRVDLPPKFVIPGGTELSARLDVARAAVRRAERRVSALRHDGDLADETVLSYLSVLLREPGASVTSGPVALLAAALAWRLALPEPPATHADLLELLESRSAASPSAEVVEDGAPDVARVEVTTTPRPLGETRVSSVLPFLLAGPLARTGYLDAIGPTLSGVDLPDDAPLFAAALAYKVLSAPRQRSRVPASRPRWTAAKSSVR